MLLDKHKPKTAADMIANREQLEEIKGWVKDWQKGQALLLHGPTGSGKSMSVEIIAKELDYELVESHASDNRSSLKTVLKAAAQKSLLLRRKLILIDEIETLDSVKGAIELIKTSEFPVIFVGTNPYEKKLVSLRQRCKLVKFRKIRSDVMARFLGYVNAKEKLNVPEADVYSISKACNGDVRAALIDLFYSNKPGVRDCDDDIFDILKTIFKSHNIKDIRNALTNANAEDVVQWLENNIAEEYKDRDEIASAYESLSKADLFVSRIIKTQSWGLQKYFIDLGVLGVSASKRHPNPGFILYSRPYYHHNQNDMNGILEKMGKKLHVSKKAAKDYLPIIKKLAQKTGIARKLDLTEEDLLAIDGS